MPSREEEIIREASERLHAALEWESTAREHARDDYKFVNGDADNGYQWPSMLMKNRELDRRPTLTINKTRQHCLQIVNDARQNRVEIRIDPVGSNATYESAQCVQDIVRHIEYQSQAEDVYISAVDFQVKTGIGYWRVLTDYVDSQSFDQEIYIRRIKDPSMVVLDPDINEFDGSDARYGFVYEDLPDSVFEKRYPKYAGKAPHVALGADRDDSIPPKHTRVCEYYRRKEKRDRIYNLDTGIVRKSDLPSEISAPLDDDDSVQKRDVIDHAVEWFLIIGNEVAQKREWPGRYIPIVRVVGEETLIDGKLDRKGHVRALKDPQRMYNYWSSAAVEFGALQSKSPYVIPIEATEGVEEYWANANTANYAYLPYKSRIDDGTPLPPPERAQPPQVAQSFLSGMQTSANEMMMVSGQYQAQMGEKSNERTGIAIQERQRQGDNSTYHYIANLASAIRYTGRIIIDLIPHVYDTERVIQIEQDDGSHATLSIDPSLKSASQQSEQGDVIQRVLNPKVGRYDVQSNVGPEFATRRQEAFNALTQLAQMSPALMEKAGDLVMHAADFPMADELAERLKPPAIDPQFQQLQMQLQQSQKGMEALMEQLAAQKSRHTAVEQQKDIDVYNAETNRLKLVGDKFPMALMPIVQQLVRDALSTQLGQVVQASQPALAQAPLAVPSDGQTPPGATPGLS